MPPQGSESQPRDATEPPSASAPPGVSVENLVLHYGATRALNGISMEFPEHAVTALIGPSGCGKSSLLRCLNRMTDLVPETRVEGTIRIAGRDIHAPDVDVIALRRQVGMVFQKSNPFPKSIYENIAYAARLHGVRRKSELDALVENSLRQAALWDEVKDRLQSSGMSLSGGQQQRLCIARVIAIQPRILLMDEPSSALDPIAAARVEELILELRRRYTIIVVTHNLQQAARLSDFTAFMYLGELVEYAATPVIFRNPSDLRTKDYVTGRFG